MRRRGGRGRTPLWSRVLADLRVRMARGEFAEAFPTDRQLVARYGVSRHTVREAVRRLKDEGVVARERGRGSFVRPLALEQRVGPLYSLFRSVEDQGHVQRSDVLAQRTVRDRRVSERLGLRADTPLFNLRRVRRADAVAFAVDDVWIPMRVARPLLHTDFRHGAVYAELARLVGVGPLNGWERISPAVAPPRERRLLGLTAADAVFVVHRYTETAEGPLEWRETLVRGDMFTYTTQWSSTGTATNFDARPRRRPPPRR